MKAPLLSLERITHHFGRVRALEDVSMTVRAGTVHALLGENGAGKSTLMRIAFGLLSPDQGVLRLNGVATTLTSPADALAAGVGMVHQHFTLVPAMTVTENVALGAHGLYRRADAARRVRDVAARAGLALDPHARVSDLPVGAQQRCEIVKALSRDVRVLILDEPTAVLAPAEAAELLQWVRRHADAGNAVVLITHKLRDALAIANDITVLRNGRVVSAGADEAGLVHAMVGEASRDDGVHSNAREARQSPAPSEMQGRNVISIRDVVVRDPQQVVRVRHATITVRAGEIVGLCAVEGAGQHELLRVLAGRLRASNGTVQIPPIVGFVPEDRHRDALLLDAPLYENIALRQAGTRRGRMRWRTFRQQTTQLMSAFDVRATGADATARTLSGGNQQKLVLGRELDRTRDALVVENPSRGLDFRATAAVHQALRDARHAGLAIVFYSSDLDEVLSLADRVFAMYNGTLIPATMTRDAIGRAMLGGGAADVHA